MTVLAAAGGSHGPAVRQRSADGHGAAASARFRVKSESASHWQIIM